MRRVYQFFLLLFLVGFVLTILYAFVDPVRAWMKGTLGPPLTDAFGGFATTITSNPLWTQYITPFPNQLILGAILVGFPIAWLWHRSFNKIRTTFVRSAAKEGALYPLQTEPVSAPSQPVQPTPITKESTKKESTPAPVEKETTGEA